MVIELFAFLLLNGVDYDYSEIDPMSMVVANLAYNLELLDDPTVKMELATLQQRYKELKDVPYVDDAKRFPDWQTARANCDWNRKYSSHLDYMLHFANDTRASEIRLVQSQLNQLYNVWKAVEEANSGYLLISTRREALKKLRELIGEEAYYSGRLPSHIPTSLLSNLP